MTPRGVTFKTEYSRPGVVVIEVDHDSTEQTITATVP
jgi:hypothetical protein